jgi:hypothetical protein
MKTILAIFFTVALSMIYHQSLCAQNSVAPFTAPSPFSLSANPQSAKITNFDGSIKNNKVLLNWSVAENQDADKFEVERSVKDNSFVMAALVFGTDKPGTDNYQFYEKAKKIKTSYRLKIIYKNGTIEYSPVIIPERITNALK